MPQTGIHLIDENGGQNQMLGDTYFAGSPVVIDSAHHEIHCGDMISYSEVTDLANAAVRDILIVTPNPTVTTKRYHFSIHIGSEAELDYRLYEGTTTSDNGTAVSPRNRNRQDPVVSESEVTITHTPTVTVVGTELEADHWGNAGQQGGEARSTNERVFKNNTKYLLRVTNATALANQVAIHINYYTHPGV